MQDFDLNKIDQYLMEQLTPAEQKAYGKLVEQNEELARLVNQRREAITAIELLGDFQMKKKVQKIHDKGVDLARKDRFKIRMRFMVAASFTGLLILASIWFFNRQPLHEKLYATHFDAYELSFGSRDDKNEAYLFQFGDFYQQKKYGEALSVIDRIPDSLITSKVNLAHGISLLSTSQAEVAIPIFRQLLEENDPIYSEQSRWYLALSYLAQNQVADCKQILSTIRAKENHFNRSQASHILEQL